MVMRFNLAPHELRGKSEVVLEAVRQDGDVLLYASEELKGCRDVVMEAVKQNAMLFGLLLAS